MCLYKALGEHWLALSQCCNTDSFPFQQCSEGVTPPTIHIIFILNVEHSWHHTLYITSTQFWPHSAVKLNTSLSSECPHVSGTFSHWLLVSICCWMFRLCAKWALTHHVEMASFTKLHGCFSSIFWKKKKKRAVCIHSWDHNKGIKPGTMRIDRYATDLLPLSKLGVVSVYGEVHQ